MTRFFLSLAAGLSLLFIATAITSAEDSKDLGPAIGQTIPHTLQLKDQNNASQSFDSLTGQKGAVIAFYRSAKWCPYCQIQLIDLNLHAASALKEKGYPLIAVSYDSVDDLATFAKKWNIEYSLLADTGSKAIDAFGIRNEDYEEGHFAHGVPHPVIFVTDTKGKILAKLYEESYRQRPPTDLILKTVSGLE
ncbi:peroxiredoxin [Kordiimonas sediminis]|uniref:thioredoxin-dependent peroxiredoxin n=1 Tax=Kordiimonas sediminis TaxID=1735581 RepID=A0A919E768_9PROT|nr:peroxiredoxin family protein [Kordiimonas sediminis]GHF20116.1 peroxiredoxin [Kordiimonas sediminis]